jgi:hypothetical protein
MKIWFTFFRYSNTPLLPITLDILREFGSEKEQLPIMLKEQTNDQPKGKYRRRSYN